MAVLIYQDEGIEIKLEVNSDVTAEEFVYNTIISLMKAIGYADVTIEEVLGEW